MITCFFTWSRSCFSVWIEKKENGKFAVSMSAKIALLKRETKQAPKQVEVRNCNRNTVFNCEIINQINKNIYVLFLNFTVLTKSLCFRGNTFFSDPVITLLYLTLVM